MQITMRPNQLKYPFSRTDRRVLIKDRIWFVPEIKIDPQLVVPDTFVFPGWQHLDLFGNDQPVNLEYCSGNGAWIAAKARENPHQNWVAIERKFDRVRKIWSKIKNANLSNLIIISGEGLHATQAYIPENSISNVYINFPDPWPKTRHHKNRIVESSFIQEMHRIMNKEGLLVMVTDDDDYSHWMVDVLKKNPGFSPQGLSTEWEGYGNSYFEQLWRDQGKTIRYHQYVKCTQQSN